MCGWSLHAMLSSIFFTPCHCACSRVPRPVWACCQWGGPTPYHELNKLRAHPGETQDPAHLAGEVQQHHAKCITFVGQI